jgi:EF hand
MQKHVLALTTSAVILACGTIAASAQQNPDVLAPGAQQGPATQERPGGPMMQQPDQQQTIREHMRERPQERAQRGEEEYDDQDEYRECGGGMMGRYGHGMMGRGARYLQGGGQGAMEGPVARVIFSLMDSDGDGTLTLQEFLAAHERIFKAMDVNKDGLVTLEEMERFIHGPRRPVPHQ